jgi:hypothetical protein
MSGKIEVEDKIDPFRSRQVPDVGGRFTRERDRHQRQADLMWLGTLVAMFSDHELRLLDDLGFLSQRDRDLLRQARTGRDAQGGQS